VGIQIRKLYEGKGIAFSILKKKISTCKKETKKELMICNINFPRATNRSGEFLNVILGGGIALSYHIILII